MFTGIVEELGRVVSSDAHRLEVACDVVARDTDVGDSIAVNGTCLTVVANAGTTLAFDLSEETLVRSSLGGIAAGDPVNLERPVTLAARLGGHLVQGHVDGVGTVMAVEADAAGGVRLSVVLPDDLLRYVVEKGSITVDGVSLTVAAIEGAEVTFALIPHTLEVTTLGSARPGDLTNIEVDVFAKYVERLLQHDPRHPDPRQHNPAQHDAARKG